MNPQPSPFIGAALAPTLLRLGIPSVLSSIMFTLVFVFETAYIGTAGTDALGAIAVVFPLVMLSYMLSGGALGGAISGATARAIGSGNSQRATAILSAALWLGVAGGFLTTILTLFFGPALYQWASRSSDIAAAAGIYASIVFPAMPILWISNSLNSVLRGSGDLKRPAIVSGIMLLSYGVFGALFIPQHVHDIDATLRAAGITTVLAYVISMGAAAYFVLWKQHIVKFKMSSFEPQILIALLKQGSLAGTQSVMTICYAMICTALFSRLGTEWLAGYGLAVRLEIIMMPIIFGIGATLIPVVGAHVGAGLRDRAISIAWRGILLNGCIITVIGLFFSLQPQSWCDSLGSTLIVNDHCQAALKVIGPTYGFFAIGLTCYIASQAFNTLLYPVLGSLTRLCLVASALLWVTPQTPPVAMLALIATAVVIYGLVTSLGLAFGPAGFRSRARNSATAILNP